MRKIKKGDTVKVMRGKDAGKTGEVLMVLNKKNKSGKLNEMVVVKDVNIAKKSVKPNPQLGVAGGIIEIEKPIHMSNVMYFDKESNTATRIGFKIDEKTKKKVRVSKKTGKEIK